jgi:hypothetical protein
MKKLGVVLSLAGVLLGLFVLLGMLGDPKTFPPSLVRSLPWCGFALAAVGVGVQWKTTGWPQTLAGLALAVQAGAALAVIAVAVGAERQNYWDAIHFASSFWCATWCAVLGLFALVRAARRAPGVAGVLAGLNGVLVVVCALLWVWMTLPAAQEFQGWVARTVYLLTHG